jgi:hypothetical protein
MSIDSEKMKALLSFRQRLEKRIDKLDNEAKELKATLDIVNSILLEKGFKRQDITEGLVIAKPKETAQLKEIVVKEQTSGYQGGEPENVIPLKTVNDESLAIIYVEKDSIHVLPDESKNFSVNTPPFQNFLVEKVFSKMQEKDAELVRAKQIGTDKAFSYSVVREGEHIGK